MSPSPSGRRTARCLGALLLACTLGAYSDGYPTQEGVLILRHGMSQDRVLELREASIRESRAADTGDYTVSLVSRSTPTMDVVVLDRMDEVDASQIVWLLNDLPRFCAADPGTRP